MKKFKITTFIIMDVPSNMSEEEVKKQFISSNNLKPADPVIVEEIQEGQEIKDDTDTK